jgi:hypothetical protein
MGTHTILKTKKRHITITHTKKFQPPKHTPQQKQQIRQKWQQQHKKGWRYG